MDLPVEQKDIINQLKSALEKANQAIEADTKGDAVNAIQKYMQVIQILDAQFQRVPPEFKTVLYDYSHKYQMRTQNIVESLTGQSMSGDSEKEQQEFEEILPPEKEELFDSVPDSPLFKTFWIMQVIAKTINSGGFLTENIFIPQSVWGQSDVKLLALPQKIDVILTITDYLDNIAGSLNMEEKDEAIKTLTGFAELLSVLNAFTAERIKGSRRYDKAKESAIQAKTIMKKGQMKKYTMQDYVDILLSFFNCAQIVDAWILNAEYDEDVEVKELLKDITQLLYYTVVSFVLKDLTTLLVRFMQKNAERFINVVN